MIRSPLAPPLQRRTPRLTPTDTPIDDAIPELDDAQLIALGLAREDELGGGGPGGPPDGAVAPERRLSPDALQALIVGKLEDDKAEDVLVIDLQGKSPLADAVVIASGRSQRHVSAIADHLQRALKDAGQGRVPIEGLPHADWVLIDAGDVVVHLFRPEVRAFYQIEKIWSVDSPHRTPATVG